jgi:CRISPR-associated protein Cas5d
MSEQWVSVRVKGDFACFTRPENKVERVTYPLPTPSAARGILEAIFWHPQFTWAVREIRVLKPVKTFSLLRNEVNNKMSADRREPYYADEDRSQRNAVCLRDVDYVILADAQVRPGGEDHAKYRDQFRRRVGRGQCYHRPALGCREFAAEFEEWSGDEKPIDWNEDLGMMLWDMSYPTGAWSEENGWQPHGKPPFWPLFFSARIESGVLNVPDRSAVTRGEVQ